MFHIGLPPLRIDGSTAIDGVSGDGLWCARLLDESAELRHCRALNRSLTSAPPRGLGIWQTVNRWREVG